MRHPKRLLQEYLDGQATPAHAAAVQAHLDRCAVCRAEAARVRRLRSRLRALKVPEPSPLLRERLAAAAPIIPGDEAAGHYAAEPAASVRAPRNHRLLGATGALAAGLVLTSAYLLGGWVPVPSAQQSAAGMAAVWTEVTGGGEAEELEPGQLAELRARGWACPELAAAGMSMVGAKAALIDGQPAVVMTLEGDGGTVTIYETHPDTWSGETVVDGVSGRPVTEEGFILHEQKPGGPQMWTHPERPHQAVLASNRVTYTVEAAPAGEVMDETVNEISLMESSRLVLQAPDSVHGVWERIKRGVSIMTGTGG